ncbi:hypothetical protein HZC35_01775 [Candidatus Saganbacteria bacterium]|nr:hypothetical protein [Candidatus Saganbacteria bacterium]
MKILKWSLISLAILIVALLGYLAYLGAFSSLKVAEMKMGPYVLVFEDYMGPYSGIGPVLNRVNASLKEVGIESSKGFGIYLDDPKLVKADKLRSKLGFIIEAKDQSQVGKRYKVMKWPAQNCLTAELPIRSNLSYMIGPLKAYPAFAQYAKEKGIKTSQAMEIYDMPARKIFFIMVIAK